VRFVTGLEAREVAALLFGNEAVEDAAQLTMKFDNGAVGSLHASWVARPAPDLSLTIFGTDGTIHMDARTPPKFRGADGSKADISVGPAGSSPYEDFVLA